MFYSLKGTIVFKDASVVALECGGVAYLCSASLNTLKQVGGIGDTACLYTHLIVREDAMELYGFIDKEEQTLFRMLIGVSGVGPKAALSVLSLYSPSVLCLRIASGDVKAIKQAPGVGPKIAQRLILELKDKLAKAAPSHIDAEDVSAQQMLFGGNFSEAVSALTSLGFSSVDATAALKGADVDASVEALIRYGLKKLSGN